MKYLDFFRLHSQNLLDTLGIDWQLPAVEILLPIGISYYTFHSITYLVAAYRASAFFLLSSRRSLPGPSVARG